MGEWRLGLQPALHGFRAVAVLLVLASHVGVPYWNGGQPGVVAFFTLSGFLITSLLLEERRREGRIALGAFYARRMRRLAPALVASVALSVLLQLVIWRRVGGGDIIAGSLTWTANFFMLDGDFYLPSGLGGTWSLAIEEQFYLTWPLVLVAVAALPRNHVVAGLSVVCCAVLAWRVVLWDGDDSWSRLYFGTDTRADVLLVGCLLAFALHRSRRRTAGRAFLPIGLALVMVTASMVTQIHRPTAYVVLPSVTAVGSAMVIFAVVKGRGAWLAWPPLQWAGLRSYGIYLYQGPIITAVHHELGTEEVVGWLVAVPIVLVAAELSWRYVEQPFLRPPRPRREPQTAAQAATQRVSASLAAPESIAAAARVMPSATAGSTSRTPPA